MNSKINPGDVVMLNSGGPRMTVEYTTELSGKVTVVWATHSLLEGSIDDYTGVMRHTFPAACLKVVG